MLCILYKHIWKIAPIFSVDLPQIPTFLLKDVNPVAFVQVNPVAITPAEEALDSL